MKFVTLENILFILRSSEDYHGNFLEILVFLDYIEHFEAVFTREIEIQQNHVGPGMGFFFQKEIQSFLAVSSHRKGVSDFALLQGFPGKPHVSRVILHEKNFNQFTSGDHGDSPLSEGFSGAPRRVKEKVAPFDSSEDTQIRPPWRSTMRLQRASPRPVPGYSSEWFSL
jgi:hypothetical protein